jgi:hypothetical protein
MQIDWKLEKNAHTAQDVPTSNETKFATNVIDKIFNK